ncbi:MAG: hypothetical protein M9916_01300 [Crocinitomicaceae bacterium]|nr:hypothetical protein [Crocinitomicaceae bacterium]
MSFLNWGKGHLSRSIDICRKLAGQNNQLFIACEWEDFLVLSEYISNTTHVSLANYPFQFSGSGNFAKDLWKSRKKLQQFMNFEQVELEKLVIQHAITLVVSDHRYGFYSKHVPSIFITHQLNLALKWWQFPAQYIHNNWLKAFSFIWIVDDEKERLAGRLSDNKKWKNSQYIGYFSRFDSTDANSKTLKIGVCNGPYPYNQHLLHQLELNSSLDFIISSLPSNDKRVIHPNTWKEADVYFYQAIELHGYCGYSTLMDIQRLNCKGVLIPTPGQSEQEYLYRLHYNH